MRIGHGYDVHKFIKGRDLILGGVTIPHDKGLDAHSDGDVIIHSLCDALLGAAGLGDIGKHFPDDDQQYKNINSRLLLQKIMEILDSQKYSIGNVDITVVAQEPKLSPYTAQMSKFLAEDLGAETSQINIKATTTEGMGFTGRSEGIAVYSVVLLDKI